MEPINRRRLRQIREERRRRKLKPCEKTRKRSLRAIGYYTAGSRQQGGKRQHGRIFGCLPTAECECACGQVNSQLGVENTSTIARTLCYKTYALNAVIRTCALNLANTACVVIMAAAVSDGNQTLLDIQRPLGTDVTDQRASPGRLSKALTCGDTGPYLVELEACESLPAGAYTWSLVANNVVGDRIYGSWIKAREITCT